MRWVHDRTGTARGRAEGQGPPIQALSPLSPRGLPLRGALDIRRQAQRDGEQRAREARHRRHPPCVQAQPPTEPITLDPA
jgi:hypothetical protein